MDKLTECMTAGMEIKVSQLFFVFVFLFKAHLEQQLTVEKSKMDTEVKKFKAALDEKVP